MKTGLKYKLPKAFKRDWLKNLRSRKFIQGHGTLFEVLYKGKSSQNRYCCMGVAGAMCGVTSTDLLDRGYLSCLSPKQRKKIPKLALRALKQLVGEDTVEVHLALMNDQYKYKFYQIARWIKRNL